MVAVRMLRSVSAICSETSLDVPTLSGAAPLDSSSPADRWTGSLDGLGRFGWTAEWQFIQLPVILAVKGLPGIWRSSKRTMML